MYRILENFLQRPQPFSRYTAKALWTRPHLANQMLSYHLDQHNDLASRNFQTITQTVDWIDDRLNLSTKKLCDLGCGPGLYAECFYGKGARVIGVDFSVNSIEYAKGRAHEKGIHIDYVNVDYLSGVLPEAIDIVTMIYCDFCALSLEQRGVLLARISKMLPAGGHFVFDVAGVASFRDKTESSLVEKRLMNGFWAEGEYVGLRRSFIYPEISLALDRYMILEPDETWEIFNWFQHFTPVSIEAELDQAGFEVEVMTDSLAGEKLTTESEVFGIIARKK